MKKAKDIHGEVAQEPAEETTAVEAPEADDVPQAAESDAEPVEAQKHMYIVKRLDPIGWNKVWRGEATSQAEAKELAGVQEDWQVSVEIE